MSPRQSGETKKLPQILFEIGKVIGSAEHLGSLLAQISRLVTRLVGAQACSILLLDAPGERLLGKAAYGLDRKDVEAISFRVGEGVAGWVAANSKPALIGDVSRDTRFVNLDDSDHRIVSLICVPIRSRNERIGVLTATSPNADAFDNDDLELLEFVATTMALDVQNLRLRRLALTDALTGAFNREFLARELPAAIARAKTNEEPLSVAMIDIDHFKQVNDAHGHDAGDQVLAEVAERLRGAIRGDDLLIRYGGEEFMVILPKSNQLSAKVVAERIRQRVADGPIPVGDLLIDVRVSVGVATHKGGGEEPRDLTRRADGALYAAKDAGRNRVASAS